MKIFFHAALSFVLFAVSCETAKNNNDPYFMTDAEELFFKNVRQSDYDVTENSAAGMKVFTHQEASVADDVTIQIIQKWREDNAYVMLQWSANTPPDTLHNKSGSIVFTGQNIENHRKTAFFLYQSLIENRPVMAGKDTLSISDAFRISMKDYIKLISRK